MWIVYFWASCPIVGDYLERMRFYDYDDAVLFAEETGGTLESRLAG